MYIDPRLLMPVCMYPYILLLYLGTCTPGRITGPIRIDEGVDF